MKLGAELICDVLLNNNINVCFANPGTSEMHLVNALDARPEMRCILGLFEGVVTGAADGYARMAGKPAVTLLHLGPGLANGLANMHNARKASSAMINIIGDHATYHEAYDAPLTSDTVGVALPMSDWVRKTTKIEKLETDILEAITIANTDLGKVATVVVPADIAWTKIKNSSERLQGSNHIQRNMSNERLSDSSKKNKLKRGCVAEIARQIANGSNTLVLAGGDALLGENLRLLATIAEKFGATLLAETSNKRMTRGFNQPLVKRVPYQIQEALKALESFDSIILVGSKEPVAFFAYPKLPSQLLNKKTKVYVGTKKGLNCHEFIKALANELNINNIFYKRRNRLSHDNLNGSEKLGIEAVSKLVAQFLPDQAIVCDESITLGSSFEKFSLCSNEHDYLQLTGGAIGIGIPLSIGASVACPDRKVINLQADGSAMFTVQGLWTQARENLNCLTIILSNRRYATLANEMKKMGIKKPGSNAVKMMDLNNPPIDWVRLARSMGVSAKRAKRVDEFLVALQEGLKSKSPYLIEAVI